MIILQASNVARRFSGVTFFENISMQIQDKGRVGLVGRNGAGKSTLLKMLIGETQPDEGTISMKKGIKLAYLAQNSGLDSDLSVYNEMLDAFSDVIALEKKMRDMETKIASATDYESDEYASLLSAYDQAQHDFSEKNGYGYEATIRSVLHGFGFDESFYDQKIQSLSGGQRTRLAIAKQLLETPDLLILDEPTNHLDIDSREVLETALNEYNGTIFFVSHDRYFINSVATEVVELSPNGTRFFDGDYDYYLEKTAGEQTETHRAKASFETTAEYEEATAKEVETLSREERKERQKEQRKYERAVAAAEEEMAGLNDKRDALNAELNDPANGADLGKLTDLSKEIADIDAQLAEVEERWTEASMALEEFDI